MKRSITARRISWLAAMAAGLVTSAPGLAVAQVVDGLVADLRFNEGSGDAVVDHTGAGHTGTVSGQHEWTEGRLHHIANTTDYGWTSVVRGDLLALSWTVDLWFQAHSSGELNAGRVLDGTTDLGGTGPEWFFRNGLYVAMRINNTDATWDEPLVGSRSNAGPPDHYGLPSSPIEADTRYHIVVTHDHSAKRVQISQGRADAMDLALVFDATYSGTYEVSIGDLRLGRSHRDDAPRYFDGYYDRLRVYDRVLSSAEIEDNHDSGADGFPAELDAGTGGAPPDASTGGAEPTEDAGLPDSSVGGSGGLGGATSAGGTGATTPTGGTAPSAPPLAPESEPSCGCRLVGTSRDGLSTAGLGALLLLLGRRKRGHRAPRSAP